MVERPRFRAAGAGDAAGRPELGPSLADSRREPHAANLSNDDTCNCGSRDDLDMWFSDGDIAGALCELDVARLCLCSALLDKALANLDALPTPADPKTVRFATGEDTLEHSPPCPEEIR